MTPKLIHIIYFPWDENHQLKANELDFDQAPIEQLRQYAPDFEVRLWTYSKARDFCRQHYPDVWKVVEQCPHPTMMVDILRWVVVLHFGGLYWQISTTPLVPMKDLLPGFAKHVRLYTEFVLTPAQCQAMASEPIRNGEPEEPIRVLNQVFAATPGAPFIQRMLDLILERNRTLVPKCDYDVLYIGANAALSTAYDRHGKDDSAVELISREQSKRMIHWRYLGSWRKDPQQKAKKEETLSDTPTRFDHFPLLAATVYRWLKTHPHELMLAEQNAKRTRKSCLADAVSFIREFNIRTVCEAPCGMVGDVPEGIHYVGATPDRSTLADYKKHASLKARFRYANMLYSCFPRVELFICPDFLEYLPYRECLRVLRRILHTARPRYLALTGYQFLNDAWDTALGDFRPIAFHIPPFCFPKPMDTIPLSPHPNTRTDRVLNLFDAAEIPLASIK